MRIIGLLFLSIIFSTPVFSNFKGDPIVKNFSPSDYHGGSRIYSIVCTSNGLLYAGDKSGVLEFDGETWHKIECGFPVTSMCVDNNNVVYVTGNNGIGKLKTNARGELDFVSLQHYFSEIHSENLRHAKVFNIENEIIFVLGKEILVITSERLRIIESPRTFEYYQKVGNEIFLYSPKDGVYKFHNSKLDLITNQPEVLNRDVKGFYLFGSEKALVTTDGDILQFTANAIVEIDTEIAAFIRDNTCRDIFQISDSSYVLNTFYSGFITFNSAGKVINRYNYDHGLISNTVFCVTQDLWGNLWVGTAAGLSAIRLHFPLTRYNNREGIGTGYGAQLVNDNLYLGTSQGLYIREKDAANNISYKLIFAGHIFGVHKIEESVLIGHASGVYMFQNEEPIQICAAPGGWDLKQVPWSKNHFIITTVRGLVLLEKTSKNKLHEIGVIRHTKWANQHFEFGANKSVWVESKYGVTRFTLTNDLTEAENIEHFDRIEEGDHIQKVRNILNELYFIADSGIYVYNATNGFEASAFSETLKELNIKPKNLFVDAHKMVWVFSNNKLLKFKLHEGKLVKTSIGMLEYASALYPTNYENICDLDSNYVLIGQELGFLCYGNQGSSPGIYSLATIRQIQLRADNGETKNVWGTVSIDNNSYVVELADNIKYKDNSIKFYYASGASNYNEINYQSILIGYDENWSAWSSENIREYTNLPPGSYKFVVRSINQAEQFSYITYCTFTINTPWYLSKLAIFCYFLCLVVILFLFERYFRFRVKRIQKRNLKKREDIQFRKEQVQIQDKLITEKELIRLKNEKLKTDILYKSKELADSTMNVIEKNRFLTEIKTDLEEIKKFSEKNKLVTGDVVKVIRKINRGINNEENWKVFEDYFDNVHENFFKKMKIKYPILTAKDLRLCAYLRMNLSTKEIAPLLNISVRGVEISRYRLRKKMALDKDENLIEFLLKI